MPRLGISPPGRKTFIEENLYRRSVQRILGIGGDTEHAPVLVHGDFGYHNVICDLSGQNRVIDWEMAGMGDPRMDLANVLFWTHLHFPDHAGRFGEAFIRSYLNRRWVDCSPESMHSFVIFQVWRILGLVNGDFPDHVKAEWNRRLAWALDHRFI